MLYCYKGDCHSKSEPLALKRVLIVVVVLVWVKAEPLPKMFTTEQLFNMTPFYCYEYECIC